MKTSNDLDKMLNIALGTLGAISITNEDCGKEMIWAANSALIRIAKIDVRREYLRSDFSQESATSNGRTLDAKSRL